MRKALLYILVAVGTLVLSLDQVEAQHYVGIRGGAGSGNARFEPKEEMEAVWGMPSFGVAWKYYSPERVVGGIGAELMFIRRGYKILTQELENPNDPDSELKTVRSYERTINSVMLPLIWQPHGYLFDRRVRVFLNLAVTFSYNLNSKYVDIDHENNITDKGTYKMMTTRDNRFDYGLFGGAGISWLINRWEITGEFRYHFGFGDILRNPNKYKGNPQRSPLDGMQFQMGVYYRLGKGGILSPRHPRYRPPKGEVVESLPSQSKTKAKGEQPPTLAE